MLELLHVLFQRQHLLLQFVAQAGQRVADVVGELLVERFLQVRCAQLVGEVPVRAVAQEEVALGLQRQRDVLAAFDVLLRAIDDADVAAAQRQQPILQDVAGVGALVHQVQLGDDADRPDALRIDLLGQLQRIGVGQIGVGRRHRQYQARVLANELEDHRLDLGLDVDRLVADRHLCQARQIDQRQIEHVRRVDAQIDRNVGDSLVAAGDAVRFGLDLLADFDKVHELFALAVQKFAKLCVGGRERERG